MVVGPQQHWLHINQHHFKTWTSRSLPRWTKATKFSTPPRSPLSNIDKNNGLENTPLPVPTTCQPRKNMSSPKRNRVISLGSNPREVLTEVVQESIETVQNLTNKNNESYLVDSTNLLGHGHKEVLKQSNPFITVSKKIGSHAERKTSASISSNSISNTMGISSGRVAKSRCSRGRV